MRVGRVLVVLVALAVAYGSDASAAPRIPDIAGARAPGSGLLWSGTTFLSRADFADWLKIHHVGYRHWAARHPGSAAVFGETVSFAPWQLAPRVSSAPVRIRSLAGDIVLALAAGGLALLGLAALPLRPRIFGPAAVARLVSRRTNVSIIGVGLLLGALVARLAA